jgi:hypothetical protein
MEKRRSRGVVSGETLFADVKGRTVVIIDDLISTGTTLLRAAKAAREHGARRVYAAASHGLFIGHADQLLTDPALDKVVVTDSVPPFRLDPNLAQNKLVVLDARDCLRKRSGACTKVVRLSNYLAPRTSPSFMNRRRPYASSGCLLPAGENWQPVERVGHGPQI